MSMSKAMGPDVKAIMGLTQRQRDVMELVIQHRTSKEIARDLGIAPNTVDQRINAVRDKLGARDRAEAARMYVQLKSICGESTYGSPVVDSSICASLAGRQDIGIDPVFALGDSAVAQGADWAEIGSLVVPRVRLVDTKLWRVAMIVGIAAAAVAIAVLMLSAMNALNTLV